MAKTPSTMKLTLGAPVPNFTLPVTNAYNNNNTTGTETSINLHEDCTKSSELRGGVIVFTCNHCPFAKHIADVLSEIANEYLPQGIKFYAINSNDADRFPQDSPEAMAVEAKRRGFNFPYLFDETQNTAKAYYAACTPDVFVFDKALKLYYCGGIDETTPNKEGIKAHGKYLKSALTSLLAGDPPPSNQQPSIGCNIKWKPGNAPAYFAEAP
ncbi:hypothetical protein COTS27_01213 [Spirochaetota bacterium]|nr:hypothetical protein COTS27_01213 [Spirochaetota bacterium]